MRFSTPDRGGRNTDTFKRQSEQWRHAYAQAGTMGELFPKVEELLIASTFVDPISLGHYSPRQHIIFPAAKAFFAFACPRTLCLHGGFRLEEVVIKALKAGKVSASGTLECPGHMEPPESQPVPCSLRMDYRIDVRYAPSKKR
ncbi:MAG: hypothetical protein IT532_00835 [Burkholderiales bacterium]|nr:hypothetical protein [Burkholderiales bacterium]